jgi:hypothetical protein
LLKQSGARDVTDEAIKTDLSERSVNIFALRVVTVRFEGTGERIAIELPSIKWLPRSPTETWKENYRFQTKICIMFGVAVHSSHLDIP